MDNKYMCHASLLQQQHMQQQQQFAERILEHLAFNSDILERWHQIGSAQGLTTDLEVATFLIQHYENTWDRAQPTEFCMTCHSPLSLSCTKCTVVANGNNPNPTPNPNPTTNTHDHSDVLSPLFNPGDGSAGYSMELHPMKAKKRKKGKKYQGADGGGSVDNDDDLLGLCIQFGQPHLNSGSISDHGVITHAEGKPPKKKTHKGKAGPRKEASQEDGNHLKSYVCLHCGKTIFKLSDFKKHVRTHTREKPYKCQYCESAFSDASSAARHRRIHTGEKPFKCEVCPSAFAQSSDLTKHMRVHTQERPWQCQVCQKTFSDSSRFAHHRRKHEKEANKPVKNAGVMTQTGRGMDVAVS